MVGKRLGNNFGVVGVIAFENKGYFLRVMELFVHHLH